MAAAAASPASCSSPVALRQAAYLATKSQAQSDTCTPSYAMTPLPCNSGVLIRGIANPRFR